MNKKFEISLIQSDLINKCANIDVLFGYPNLETKTECYREIIKKYDSEEWAGVVGSDLENACSEMSESERLEYYDPSDLKSRQWLVDNGWFSTDAA
jgi:hypothetical protein